MLIPVHYWKHQQWTCECQNWTRRWSALTIHVDDKVSFYLEDTWQKDALCDESLWKRCSALAVCWQPVGPPIHMDVTLTRTTYLSAVADHQLSHRNNRFVAPATEQTWFRDGLQRASLRPWHGPPPPWSQSDRESMGCDSSFIHSAGQIPQPTFKGLAGSTVHWVRAVGAVKEGPPQY